jgi:hypothetical protein
MISPHIILSARNANSTSDILPPLLAATRTTWVHPSGSSYNLKFQQYTRKYQSRRLNTNLCYLHPSGIVTSRFPNIHHNIILQLTIYFLLVWWEFTRLPYMFRPLGHLQRLNRCCRICCCILHMSNVSLQGCRRIKMQNIKIILPSSLWSSKVDSI